MSPYDEGYNACLEGAQLTANPYGYTTSEYAEWNRGWRHAQEDGGRLDPF